jgi:hypothetical protein
MRYYFLVLSMFLISCQKEYTTKNSKIIEHAYSWDNLQNITSFENYNTVIVPYESNNEEQINFILQHEILPIENKLILTKSQYEEYSKLNLSKDVTYAYLPQNAEDEKDIAQYYATTLQSVSGKIKVFDALNGSYYPLKNIRIHVVDGIRTLSTDTDDEGNFSIQNKILTGKVDVYVHFKNKDYEIRVLDIDHLELALFPLYKKIKTYRSSEMQNINIELGGNQSTDTSKQTIYAATAWHDIFSYKTFAEQHGYIFKERRKLSLWIAKDALLSTSYAAPMLYQLGTTTYPKELLNKLFNVPSSLAAPIARLLRNTLPDIYAPYYTTKLPGESFTLALFHEFSHVVHYNKAGDAFWSKFIQYIYSNTGYGSGEGPEKGRVGMSESWAEDLSMQCARYIYGQQKYNDLVLDSNTSSALWIPWGVYYDLTDNSSILEPWDEVNQFGFKQIYDMFNPQMENIEQLKTQLKATYDQIPLLDAKIDTLYSHYGW